MDSRNLGNGVHSDLGLVRRYWDLVIETFSKFSSRVDTFLRNNVLSYYHHSLYFLNDLRSLGIWKETDLEFEKVDLKYV